MDPELVAASVMLEEGGGSCAAGKERRQNAVLFFPPHSPKRGTMSRPHLPPEILEYILDTLHDDPKTLRDCCVVAKSWIPRTKNRLFAKVRFSSH